MVTTSIEQVLWGIIRPGQLLEDTHSMFVVLAGRLQ